MKTFLKVIGIGFSMLLMSDIILVTAGHFSGFEPLISQLLRIKGIIYGISIPVFVILYGTIELALSSRKKARQ